MGSGKSGLYTGTRGEKSLQASIDNISMSFLLSNSSEDLCKEHGFCSTGLPQHELGVGTSDPIDRDETIYYITIRRIILPSNSVSLCVSKILLCTPAAAKKLLSEKDIVISGTARKTKMRAAALANEGIEYTIRPDFPYEVLSQ